MASLSSTLRSIGHNLGLISETAYINGKLRDYAKAMDSETGKAREAAIRDSRLLLGGLAQARVPLAADGLNAIVPSLIEATFHPNHRMKEYAVEALKVASVEPSSWDSVIAKRASEMANTETEESVVDYANSCLSNLNMPSGQRYRPFGV